MWGHFILSYHNLSLPSWECGLKSEHHHHRKNPQTVTPLVGVWIEMGILVWSLGFYTPSLPSWECGLKFMDYQGDRHGRQVTPLVGVWIEISKTQNANQS